MALSDYRMLTAEEVAQHLRVSVKTVYRWAKSGELPCTKWGRTVRFLERDVEAHILKQRGGDQDGVASA